MHTVPSTEAYRAEFFKLLDAAITPLTSMFYILGDSPQMAAKLCSKFFLAGTMNYKYIGRGGRVGGLLLKGENGGGNGK